MIALPRLRTGAEMLVADGKEIRRRQVATHEFRSADSTSRPMGGPMAEPSRVLVDSFGLLKGASLVI